MNEPSVKRFLKNSNFEYLFVEELGWNPVESTQIIPIEIQQATNEPLIFYYDTKAELKNFRIFVCPVQIIPTLTTCRKCDSQLRKYANDYISIYYIPKTEHHAWVVPVKRVEKRDLVLIEYETSGQAGFLIQKLGMLEFAMDMDEMIHISDVRERVNAAFLVNSEKITKDFYNGFRKQHDVFSDFIQNLMNDKDRKWYTSVMLNRLMFCYFIQKKGFLDRNPHYLKQKLQDIQKKRGSGKYYSFYRAFLRRLFSDGLNRPKHDHEFEKDFGQIPYLNGGMFDTHQIERDHPELDIADEAFEKLFDFFDKYQWHLDTRITASGKDINPDVLGYIFEQYINDRAAMGAYYTKEDITEYIGKNCIIPWLLDALSRSTDETCHDLEPDGYVWQTMKNSGDKYVYDAVKKGYTNDWKKRIPQKIAKGLDTTKPNLLERRARWNDKTPEEFALPTEIWRETIARLQRCEDLLHKIESGEICHPNDLITYNLDMRQFAYDLIAKADSPAFVCDFFNALKKITVLDPTCGSGAFLFAALNILEPLYEICIERMQDFAVEKASSSLAKKYKHHLPRIKDELADIESKYRSNIQYFIYKTIILNNLYGVDIMPEAVEIAKLRLFLKLVAVVDVDVNADNLGLDPLPDIDFNIRCGNTLVGYATKKELDEALCKQYTLDRINAKNAFEKKINDGLNKVAKSYADFLLAQRDHSEDMKKLKTSKDALNTDLKALNDILNHHYHQATQPHTNYSDWLVSYQPFHWLAEFYTIMKTNGGFDVIIGNPPYVNSNNIDYLLPNNDTKISNIYGHCLIRSKHIAKGYLGMIIPLSITFNNDFCTVRYELCNNNLWHTSYDNIPDALFDGVSQRCTVIINDSNQSNIVYASRMYRWKPEYRSCLFNNLEYFRLQQYKKNGILLRLPIPVFEIIWVTIIKCKHVKYKTQYSVKFSNSARNYLSVFIEPPPCLSLAGSIIDNSKKQSAIAAKDECEMYAYYAVLTCDTALLIWLMIGDGMDVTSWNLIPIISAVSSMSSELRQLLYLLGFQLHSRRFECLQYKKNAGKYVGSFCYTKLFEITRRVDMLFLSGLGIGVNDVLLIRDIYSRIFSINEDRGEKSIPDYISNKYPLQPYDNAWQNKLFDAVDDYLINNYSYTKDIINLIIYN